MEITKKDVWKVIIGLLISILAIYLVEKYDLLTQPVSEKNTNNKVEMDIVPWVGIVPRMLVCFDTLSGEIIWEEEVSTNRMYLPVLQKGESVVGFGHSVRGASVLITFQVVGSNLVAVSTVVAADGILDPEIPRRFKGEIKGVVSRFSSHNK